MSDFPHLFLFLPLKKAPSLKCITERSAAVFLLVLSLGDLHTIVTCSQRLPPWLIFMEWHTFEPPVTFFSINFWLFFLEVSFTCFIVTAVLFHSSPGFLSSLVAFLSCFIPLMVSYLLAQQRVKSWHHFSSLENGTLQRTHAGRPAPPLMPIDLSEEIGKDVSVDSLRSFGTSLLSVVFQALTWSEILTWILLVLFNFLVSNQPVSYLYLIPKSFYHWLFYPKWIHRPIGKLWNMLCFQLPSPLYWEVFSETPKPLSAHFLQPLCTLWYSLVQNHIAF